MIDENLLLFFLFGCFKEKKKGKERKRRSQIAKEEEEKKKKKKNNNNNNNNNNQTPFLKNCSEKRSICKQRSNPSQRGLDLAKGTLLETLLTGLA